MEEPYFLEDIEKIQREMCKNKGNIMSLILYIKNFIDISEWLHESYLNNNEVIHNLTIQNEQLLEKLQDTLLIKRFGQTRVYFNVPTIPLAH